MTTNSPHASATIIPFPTRARTPAGGNFDKKSSADQPVTQALSGSWYHDEAIQEATWSKKH